MSKSEHQRTLPYQESREILSEEVFQAKAFVQAVKEVCFAASRDDSQPMLKGAVLNLDEDGLELMATDGHRGSCVKIERKTDSATSPGQVIVPANFLPGACRLFFGRRSLSGHDVVLRTMPGVLEIESTSSGVRVNIPTMDGPYPEWKSLIPQKTEGVGLNRKKLLEIMQPYSQLSRIGLFPDGPEKILVLKQYYTSDYISGEYRVEKRVESVPFDIEGELPNEVTFYSQHLRDLLRNVSSVDVLRLEVTPLFYPVVFRKPNNQTFFHMILSYPAKWDT